jgi:LDH2 family malate/lactate/ureidoglycolate dehydrogenase
MSEMMKSLRSEPRRDENTHVQVPGDPEKKIAKIRLKQGIPISKLILDDFIQISKDYNVDFKM